MKKDVLKWSKGDRELIEHFTKEALGVLNMQSWTVYGDFVDGPVKVEEDSNGKGFIADAVNSTTQEYEKIAITWMPALLEQVKKKNLQGVRETVFHEVAHGLTQELYDLSLERFATKEECRIAVERLTQRITMICIKMLTKRKK